MTSFSLPALTSVGKYLAVLYNDALTSFEVPALTSVASLLVYHNDALTSFEVPALTSVGSHLRVYGNTALAQCLVDALVEQIEAGEGIGDEIIISDNNTNCTCSEVGGVLEATCP